MTVSTLFLKVMLPQPGPQLLTPSLWPLLKALGGNTPFYLPLQATQSSPSPSARTAPATQLDECQESARSEDRVAEVLETK